MGIVQSRLVMCIVQSGLVMCIVQSRSVMDGAKGKASTCEA